MVVLGLQKKKATRTGASVKTLDKWFSKLIRRRDTKPVGDFRIGRCASCTEVKSYEKLDCGHYVGREHWATRWNPMNCAAQCWDCNRFSEGNKGQLRIALVKKYGEDAVARMEGMRRMGQKPRAWEALLILEGIKQKLNALPPW